MQSLLKIEYLMKTTIHGKICFTSHIKLRPISIQGPQALGLIMEYWVDMGCDIEFAIYYTLFITFIIKTYMEYTPITLPFMIRRKTKYAVRKVFLFQFSSTHQNHLFTKFIYTDLEREELGCFHFRSFSLKFAFFIIALNSLLFKSLHALIVLVFIK